MAAELLPPPSPSPSPSSDMSMAVSSTLGGRINTACRKQHTDLNRSLIQRLPLALPPNQDSPLLLGRGIVPFARIFIFFECEWDLLVRRVQQRDPANASHDDSVQTWLANLRPHGLARATRLENDLKHLRAVAGPNIYSTPELGDKWTKDMRTRVRHQPHVLVAFAWVFYMATFAGGRYIRQQLANGGVDFWTKEAAHEDLAADEKTALEMPGYSFLSFDGYQDGEDIKAQFKARFAEAEELLTEEQKQQVIDVAQRLFERCNKLVGQLDQMVIRDKKPSWIPSALLVLLLIALSAGWRTSAYYPGHSYW